MSALPNQICGISRQDYLIKLEEFHGHISPGTVMGGFLVDAAWNILGETPYINVVVETVVCLPDSVQALTPCTLGNGFLVKTYPINPIWKTLRHQGAIP